MQNVLAYLSIWPLHIVTHFISCALVAHLNVSQTNDQEVTGSIHALLGNILL